MRIAPPLLLIAMLFTPLAGAQNCPQETSNEPAAPRAAKSKPQPPFQWVNPLPKGDWPDGLSHHTFHSPSMQCDVGYCIYLPPGYDEPSHAQTRYPVVYYLHGGRPGSEVKSVKLTSFIHDAMSQGKVAPAIYVFVNGGEVSHYNYPEKNSLGEDVFINELIPHIDQTYRTIARREGRGIEGFSQGGRGTTRIMFRHPELFCSAAPGGSGYATEKRISESEGRESETLVFAKGYNTWDAAREYAKLPHPPLRILVHVGTKDFNYEANQEYMAFLDSLKIPHESLVVPDVPHSAMEIYQRQGLVLMKFHETSFKPGRN